MNIKRDNLIGMIFLILFSYSIMTLIFICLIFFLIILIVYILIFFLDVKGVVTTISSIRDSIREYFRGGKSLKRIFIEVNYSSYVFYFKHVTYFSMMSNFELEIVSGKISFETVWRGQEKLLVGMQNYVIKILKY